MPLFASTTVLRIIDATAIVLNQSFQLARARLASAASPVLRMLAERDHALNELTLLRREVVPDCLRETVPIYLRISKGIACSLLWLVWLGFCSHAEHLQAMMISIARLHLAAKEVLAGGIVRRSETTTIVTQRRLAMACRILHGYGNVEYK